MAKIIPAQSNVSLENDIIFKWDDVSTSNLSTDSGNQKTQQAWVGLSKAAFRESILNRNANKKDDPYYRMCYLKQDSILYQFIISNWATILSSLGENPNQKIPYESWNLPLKVILPAENLDFIPEAEKDRSVLVHPMLTRIVLQALRLAETKLDSLPFEDLQNQQFYFARLDADSWTSPHGNFDAQQMAKIQDQRFSLDVQVEAWYEVVSESIQPATPPPQTIRGDER